jgi:predicted O-linked N-acetylglucosamine transferase (SPINDLY family)
MFKWFGRRDSKAQSSPTEASASHPPPGSKRIEVAVWHHQAGRLKEADGIYQSVLADEPENFDALHLSGVIAHQLGKHDAASKRILRAIGVKPTHAPAQNNLGVVFRAQGRLEDSLACFRKALDLQPGYAEARTNLFEVHLQLGNKLKDTDLQAAGGHFRAAVALQPASAAAHTNLGNVLNMLGDAERAIPHYKKAIKLDAGIPEVYLNLGNALKALRRIEDAITAYRTALTLRPDSAETQYVLGNALKDQDDLTGMLECYQRALTLKPDYAEARWALTMCQIPAVYESDAEPDHIRTAFASQLEKLDRWFNSARAKSGFSAVGTMQPFLLAYQERDNRDLLERYGKLCTRIMSAWLDSGKRSRLAKRRAGGTVRVGVVSQYFFNHSVWNAIVKGWFHGLDRDRISLHAFYPGMHEDHETQFAKKRAVTFEMGQRDLAQWVDCILGQSLDVLIYPEIGMDPMTARLASLRLTQVQVVSWGHPETSGLPTIDYFLSAADMEPANAQDFYTERLVALPHVGCFCEISRIAAANPGLSGLGLDSGTPVLLCPGVPFKYAPQHDRVFVEIARRLGRCRLVFFTHRLSRISEKLLKRLERSFSAAGLDATQFVTFVPWQDSPEFHGWLRRADVFLDSIGFSGFNTAIQAVQCGTPIVTKEGRFMRGRLASGILKRMGLTELVANSEEQYIALAVRLATDVEYRAHIRSRTEKSRSVLFEDVAPLRALEDFLVDVTRS